MVKRSNPSGFGFVALLAASCLYDPNEPCGEHQELVDNACVCVDGYGLVAEACLKCPRGEVGNPLGPCACSEGMSRSPENGRCGEALGQACSSDLECTEPSPTCHGIEASGYCTLSGCRPGKDDCPGDFACNDREGEPFCERPPSGLGASCDASEDCRGFEASYCESLSEHACLVEGCAENLDRCHGDWVCCDIALLGASLCIPPNELEDGACPVGGTLISR
jgi:hypothetical protein